MLGRLAGRQLGALSHAAPSLSANDWDHIPSLAASHRLLPLIHDALKADPKIEAPPKIREQIQRDAMAAWIQSAMLTGEAARISRLFRDSHLTHALIKGPAIAQQAYPAPALRSMNDLDILVLPEYRTQAHALLESAGFACQDRVVTLDARFQELYLRGVTHYVFHHRRLGYILELHVRPLDFPSLLPISLERLIDASEPAPIHGEAVPTLAPWDHFLLIAAHGAKHGWYRLHWLADFAALSLRFPAWFQEEGAQRWGEIHSLGLAEICAAAFTLSAVCFGVDIPTIVSQQPPNRRRCGALIRYSLHWMHENRAPKTIPEELRKCAHIYGLRNANAYRRDVVQWYWQTAQEDFERLPLPAPLLCLYPALRPWLWAVRKAGL